MSAPAWRKAAIVIWINVVIVIGLVIWLSGCAEVSSSSHDIVTHCMQHTIGGGDKIGGNTTIEDCDISIDTKSKSTGF